MNKTLKTISLIFGGVSLLMLVIATILIVNTYSFLKTAQLTSGRVIDLIESYDSEGDVSYAPLVLFETSEGLTGNIRNSHYSYPAAYEIDEIVNVYYNPDRITEARLSGYFSLWGGATICGIVGLVFGTISLVILLNHIRKKNKRKYLLKNGRKITAKYLQARINTTLTVNGQHPFVIEADWENPMTKQIHFFKSENLWVDPNDYIKNNEVEVWINIDNPKLYWIDISFMPI